jgi:3-oxoadipate enol-lactonase/4-carboxymuconolactone decarboxylase
LAERAFVDPLDAPARRATGSPALAVWVGGPAAPDGAPVLMVMGHGMRGRVWRPQLAAIAPRHPVAVFDHRGIGSSDDDGRAFSMTDLAADALRAADAAGFDRFHLVGVSMGGMVSQHVAAAAPHRVRSLALIVTMAGGPFAWRPPRAGWRPLWGVIRARDASERARAMAALLYTDGFVGEASTMRQRLDDIAARDGERSALWRQLRAVMRHDARALLPRIQAPTLVVQAARDKLIDPRRSALLAEKIPGARWVRLDRAGHGLLYERADVVNALLLEHFAAHG